MPQFRFRLQTLLKVRLAQRDERREALAKALRAESIIDERITTTRQEIQAAKEAQRNGAKPGPINVDGLMNLGRHGMALQADLMRLANQREQIIAERERRREALVQADRAGQVLVKLKERQLRDFERAETLREAKMMDEVAERLHQNQKRVRV